MHPSPARASGRDPSQPDFWARFFADSGTNPPQFDELGVTIAACAVQGEGRAAERAAGREAARVAFTDAGAGGLAVTGHEPDGRPSWPAGWTGSISHASGLAVAAVAPVHRAMAVGIDIEVTGALALEDAESVLVASELAWAAAAEDPPTRATLVWSAKEAAFKAWSTAAGGLQGVDPMDIRVDVDQDEQRLRASAAGRLGRSPDAVPLVGRYAMADDLTLTVLAALGH